MEYLHNNPNAASLILTDINMPKMDGLEFLSVIKANPTFNEIPVILQTAATDEEVQKAFSLGANLHLSKPYTGTELYIAIIKVLAEQLQQLELVLAIPNEESARS